MKVLNTKTLGMRRHPINLALLLALPVMVTPAVSAEPTNPPTQKTQTAPPAPPAQGLMQRSMNEQAVPKKKQDSSVLKAPVEPMSPALLRKKLEEDRAFMRHSQQHLRSQQFEALDGQNNGFSGNAVTCDTLVSGYGSKRGQALVDHILSSPNECISDLFSGDGTAIAAFSADNMQTVANAATDLARNYNPSGQEVSLGKLYYFLRAGYYVQYYNSAQLPAYPSWVSSAIRSALDTLFANPAFYQNSEINGANIQDALTLVDSAGENARYLPIVKAWLKRWDQSYANSWAMRSAVNQIFTILFRGHQLENFKQAVANDSELIQLLGQFARNDALLGSDASFLQENAAAELARFLQYPTAAIHAQVKNEVAQLLSQYSMDGVGRNVWLKAASSVDYYGYCSDFQICGFASQLENQILSGHHTCNSTIKFRYQQMTASELASACEAVTQQEQFFHSFLKTGNKPVADDLNTSLEMVVFDSSNDYSQYAGLFFGIDTNNGGMYLEGNPQSSTNQARFVAYEAEWLRPQFEIWNLTHEAVHYYDGRFNLKGDFSAARTDTHKTVWWIEGLAEYVSKKNRNDTAIAMARSKQFTLSQIFSNTYNSGVDRVYRWGYLAVRFMFETQPATVTALLKELRAGNYDGYLALVNGLGSSLDNQWLDWLDRVQSDDQQPQSQLTETGSGTETGGTTDPNQPNACANQAAVNYATITPGQQYCVTADSNSNYGYFYFYNEVAGQKLSFELYGGNKGNADLYFSSNNWPTSSSHQLSSVQQGNRETISTDALPIGWHYIAVHANPSREQTTLVVNKQ